MAFTDFCGARTDREDQAIITKLDGNAGVSANQLLITFRLRKSLKIRPGQYVYLVFFDMALRGRFQAHPYIIAWWDDSFNARNLSFLIQPCDEISRSLTGPKTIRKVVLYGPYGVDLQLENYKTVILIAKGIEIAGILPYAGHIAYRRVSKGKDNEAYRQGLMTRKWDIFWVMEENYRQDWLATWMSKL